ncbi:hypothetical protein J6590_002022 [Homalodisca vitripennis]|nr:hypothetical protein J6590_002022 [Homalodisca vitripennis]
MSSGLMDEEINVLQTVVLLFKLVHRKTNKRKSVTRENRSTMVQITDTESSTVCDNALATLSPAGIDDDLPCRGLCNLSPLIGDVPGHRQLSRRICRHLDLPVPLTGL